MKALQLLLLLWLLGGTGTQAQTPLKGPWRMVEKRVRARKEDSEDGWGSTDTTTTWQMRKVLTNVPWDVAPDSIRLFLNCDNPLAAPPKPRSGQNPVLFTVTGATLRFDEKQRLLWVFPSGPKVVLTAYKGRNMLFRHEFQAVTAPLPQIKYFVPDSQTCNYCKEDSRLLNLKASPDIAFVAMMPDDAQYRVSEHRVTLLRQGAAVVPPITIGGPSSDMIKDVSNLMKIAQVGDQLKVEVLAVVRMNAHGIVERLPMQEQQRTFDFPYRR